MSDSNIHAEPIWHDGNIISLNIEGMKARSARLELLLLVNLETQVRRQAVIRGVGVKRLVMIGDFSELAKHAFAGQIADARIDKFPHTEVLRMQLAAGYLEIEAEQILLE